MILNPATLAPEAFSSVLKTPQRHWLVGPHVDYQLNDNNTLAVRYLYTRAAITDGGIGSFDLISRGEHILNTFNTFQAIETSLHGNTVNETRFQYFRQGNDTTANTDAPVIQVLAAFNGGGATLGHGTDLQVNYEFQNYTSVLRGKHFLRFGARLRQQTDDNVSPSNFNGTFTFSSIAQYAMGIPSQFSINAGMPAISVRQFDAGLFFGDDWRIRPNLTLNLGIRYETQTNIHDHRDIAPRVAFAWAPRPRTVIRGGVGIFYDRFALANTLTADRFNGIVQQQFVVTDPTFYPNIPPIASLAANRGVQAVWEVDSNLRAPYIVQSLPRSNVSCRRTPPSRSLTPTPTDCTFCARKTSTQA